MDNQEVLASGIVEKIGEANGSHSYEVIVEDGENVKKVEECVFSDHHDGFNQIVDLLVDPEHGIIRDKSEISAVGHRVVHGGETLHTPRIIDDRVIAAIKENIPLAPLHNPPNLIGIEVAQSIFPDSPQVAVLDTAFHQTIPKKAFLYALPYELYQRDKVRRYGFHGTSHSYVAKMGAEYLGLPLSELNLITIHLGNGASMAALKNGKCVDTSMGMTPLEGLVMGTRSGDIDPALPFFLSDHLNMSLDEIDNLLNKDSGLKGMCGTNDMREVMERRDSGDERAKIALEVYVYRIKKYIGAYFAVLGNLDVLIFTAGIGENASEIRMLCCEGLGKLDIKIDPERNYQKGEGIIEINAPEKEVKILIVPTNEELQIAQETKKVVESGELQ
jgi:acetate kinase